MWQPAHYVAKRIFVLRVIIVNLSFVLSIDCLRVMVVLHYKLSRMMLDENWQTHSQVIMTMKMRKLSPNPFERFQSDKHVDDGESVFRTKRNETC